MSDIVEPDYEYINRILFLVDRNKYTEGIKQINILKKKYKKSLFLRSLEVLCLSKVDHENKKKIMKIVNNSYKLLEGTKVVPEGIVEILDNFSSVLSFYKEYERSCEFYEIMVKKYSKKNPIPEEMLNKLFFSYIRTRDFKKQQKTSQLLDKRFKKKRYSIWWGLSMMFQVENFELEKTEKLPLFFLFCSKIFQKNLYKVKYADNEVVLLYILFCEKIGKFSEAIKVLREKVSCLFDSIPYQRKESLGNFYILNAEYSNAQVVFLHLLEHYNTEQWDWWMKYLKCYKLNEKKNENVEIEMNIENSMKCEMEKEIKEEDRFRGENNLEPNDKLYVISSKFSGKTPNEFIEFCQKKNPNFRTSFLIEIEFNFQNGQFEKVCELCVQYFMFFGEKKCCYYDLYKYFVFPDLKFSTVKFREIMEQKLAVWKKNNTIKTMEKEMKDSLKGERVKIQLLKKKKAKKNLNKKPLPKRINKEQTSFIKFLTSFYTVQINYYKIRKILSKGEGDVLILKEMYKIYLGAISRHKKFILKETTNQFADELLELIVQILLEQYIRTSNAKYICESIILLEKGIEKSKYNFTFKIFLCRLYSIFNCLPAALEIFESLEIKHVQYNTLSYLLFYNYVCHMNKTSKVQLLIGNISQFVKEFERNQIDLLLLAYRNHAWSRIEECKLFIEKLENNLLFHQLNITENFFKLSLNDSLDANEKTVNLTESKFMNFCEKYPIIEDMRVWDWYSTGEIKQKLSEFINQAHFIDPVLRNTLLNAKKIILKLLFSKKESEEDLLNFEKYIKVLQEKKFQCVDQIKLLYLVFNSKMFKMENFKNELEVIVKKLISIVKSERNYILLLQTFFTQLSFFFHFVMNPIIIKVRNKYKDKSTELIGFIQKKLKSIRNALSNVWKKKKIFLIGENLNFEVYSNSEIIEKKRWVEIINTNIRSKNQEIGQQVDLLKFI